MKLRKGLLTALIDISKYFMLHKQKPESVTSAPLAVEVERGFIDGKLDVQIWILYFNSGMLVVGIAQSSNECVLK